MVKTRDVVFDITKQYNPRDNQLYAPLEVLEVLQELSLEIDNSIKD